MTFGLRTRTFLARLLLPDLPRLTVWRLR
jgi:hypothetical protein